MNKSSTGFTGRRLPSAVSVLFLAGLCAFACSTFGGKRPRNVILIGVDTLRQDHLGCYGYRGSSTPVIDELAKGGVRFANARTSVPLTLPSFTTIFTSTYPLYHKIRRNETYMLSDSVTTLAEIFRAADYKTAAIIGSAALSSRQGLKQGFDLYDDEFDQPPPAEEETLIPPHEYGPEERRYAAEVVRRASAWLNENHEDPFFLFLHFFDAHLPHDSPKKLLPMSGYSPEELPVWAYDNEILNVDEQLGLLMKTLEELDLVGNTLVVFFSDHGEGLMEHYEATHGYMLYDSTMKIPMIFWCPGLVPEGEVLHGAFRTVDLMPTLIDIFGLEPHEGAQGVSHKEEILGEGEGQDLETYIESYYAKLFLGWSELRGVQWGEWKYIEAPKRELYNLRNDPNELVNLYEERPEVASSMEERLRSVISRYSRPDEGLGVTIPMDEGHRKALESLGYLTKVVHVDESVDSVLPDPKDMMPEYTRRQIACGKIILAGALIEGGIYDDAIQLLESAADAGERQWMVNYNLGIAFMEKGDYDRAIKELRSALDHAPIGPERMEIRSALDYIESNRQKGVRR